MLVNILQVYLIVVVNHVIVLKIKVLFEELHQNLVRIINYKELNNQINDFENTLLQDYELEKVTYLL